MQSIQFWKSWAKTYQHIGLIIGGAFVLALLFLWYSWFISPNPVLTWFDVQEQELTRVPVHTFQQGLLELTIHGDNYLIFDRLLGEHLQPNVIAGYVYLFMLVIGMVMLLSIVTTLSRFWYLLGMGLFILFIVGFRMEIISMFGQPNKLFTTGVLILYLLPSFYFQFYKTTISFKNRLFIFSGITLLLGILIVNFAEVAYPLLYLSVTGIAAGFVVSIIFIFMVAHEILASFVLIASQSAKQTKSLNHFLIISTVYMINLAIAYAHKIGSIEWNFMYINFYLLITVSGILGIWGHRQREPQYEKIMVADPFGIYFFLSIGTICFATIGYFISTANDSALLTINDAIIYGHLGFGIIFLTYVISNFFAMLANNLPVHKVLYKPSSMPYFTFRFGGIIATLAFVFYNTWQSPVQHAYSGYYNAAGDLYQTLGDNRFAEAFYQQSGTYGFLNHHSNYAIANIEAKKNYNTVKERNYYQRSTKRRPTEFAFINLSQTYQRNGQWLEARLVLNEGLQSFPNSGPLLNALGIVYSKLNLTDSSLNYLQQAIEQRATKEIAEANFIAVAAKNNLSVNADSLLRLIASDNKGVRSNALAFANIQGSKIKMEVDVKADTILNLFSASLINNYLVNHLGELDTIYINKVIATSKKKVNTDYNEALLFASALSLYADGQIGRAFSLLEEITIYSNDQDKYNTILTMWSLENKAPQDALAFIKYALNKPNTDALPVAAIAFTEAGELDEGLIRWDSLRSGPDSTYHDYAAKMMNVLQANRNSLSQLSDEEKYLYSNYRIGIDDSVQFNTTLNEIESEELKARTILARSQRLFEADEVNTAIKTFQKITGLKLLDRALYNQILHFELELLASKGDLQTLLRRINENQITFSGVQKSNEIYFKALQSEQQRDSTEASRLYHWLATANPYHEDAIIAAATYFKTKNKDRLLPYTIITDALHANPYSVKILKAYSLEAAHLQFNDYANSALERLRPLVSAQALRKFLTNNQTTFAQVIQ